MANRTVKDAATLHGKNPQYLVEKITRTKIYNAQYWKEQCFGLSAEGIVEKAMDLTCYGGMYGGARSPTNFLCLLLKMLQIQPDKEIIVEFIKNEDYKYVRLLGALYMRVVGKAKEIYQYLEPLYNDYRPVRKQGEDGYLITHVDEVIDDMLSDNFVCDIQLTRLPQRHILEAAEILPPRRSALQDDLEMEAEEAEVDEVQERKRSRSRSRSRERRELGRRERDRDRNRRERSPDRGRDRRRRDRSRERDRDRGRDRDRDRDRRRNRSPRRERERDRSTSRERSKRQKKESKEPAKDSKYSADDPEIIEQNKLRAKLGLKPLKV